MPVPKTRAWSGRGTTKWQTYSPKHFLCKQSYKFTAESVKNDIGIFTFCPRVLSCSLVLKTVTFSRLNWLCRLSPVKNKEKVLKAVKFCLWNANTQFPKHSKLTFENKANKSQGQTQELGYKCKVIWSNWIWSATIINLKGSAYWVSMLSVTKCKKISPDFSESGNNLAKNSWILPQKTVFCDLDNLLRRSKYCKK